MTDKISIPIIRGGMDNKRKEYFHLILILLGTAMMRLIGLDGRPPHPDEGVNGWFVDQLIAKGYYAYDPSNYHGPLHFYLLFLAKIFFGRNLWALRLPSVLFGCGAVYLIARLQQNLSCHPEPPTKVDGEGFRMTNYAAALFCAVSPTMIFYSRYAIHESEFLFFSLVAFLGFFRAVDHADRHSLWMLGLGVAGMMISKEVFVIHLGAFSVAWILAMRKTGDWLREPRASLSPVFLLFFTIVSGITFLFYSGFFLHLQGIPDFFRAFSIWISRGVSATGHEKPWFYWLKLFARYEWPALIGFMVAIPAFFVRSRKIRFLAYYGMTTFILYSVIRYKTPWCILQILWPFFVILACTLKQVETKFKNGRWMAIGALIFLSVVSGVKSIRLNFSHVTDPKEPYVYVQTFPQIMGVLHSLDQYQKADPTVRHMPISIVMDNSWPLPWLLGDFTQVGYYGTAEGFTGQADLVISDVSKKADVQKKLTKSYATQQIPFRDAYEEVVVFWNKDRFKRLSLNR